MSVSLHQGDCLVTLRGMADNSVDSIVTDPPYGLSFMGKKWDYDVPSVEIWAECLRVLKPGGHLLAFAGTRTQHRMAVRIEDAGFEIRDMIAWVYGCLDEATEVATESGVMPYHKTRIGDLVLCYDVEHGEYTYQPILEVVEYDYSDTAYRLVGDFGEQVVSRNHRVIVECGGSEAFNLAETLGAEARVPFLESLPALQHALHDAQQNAGRTKQDVQQGVCKHTDWACEYRDNPIGEPQGQNDQVLGLRGGSLEAERLASENPYADVQPGMQRGDSRRPMGNSRTQGSGELVGRVGGGAEGTHDGRDESVMEGRLDVPESERCVCGPADQVCALPRSAAGNGSVGRLCDGAPQRGGAGDWSAADAGGVCAPHQPRCDGQQPNEPHAVRDERTAQGVRAWGGHRSAVVRVVPFHYTGKVWCLRVPTGAFVAVRNGVAFPTGNSGFPKSLDVSKQIDKAAGAEREVVGEDPQAARRNKNTSKFSGCYGSIEDKPSCPLTAPATEAARQWQGWGTALKPAHEPIVVARKPLIGTVAANVLAHGTGALNIDGCRVGTDDGVDRSRHPRTPNTILGGGAGTNLTSSPHNELGRWPANWIHNGSDEVLAGFPDSNGSAARFFYCAKASRRDRNAGLDGHETVIIERSLTSESPKWGNADQQVVLQVDTEPSPPKVIAVSGVSNKSAHEWSTLLFGSEHTAPCLQGTTCIIETPTSSTTGLTTLSYFQNLLTSANTQVANYETESGGSPAQTAAPGTLLLRTTSGLMASALGVEHAASPTLLKISASERRSDHPTVKPTDLMAYLCRLVTPPGGIVLDPFMGSGSTGKAALREGFRFIGIEKSPEYMAIAEARVK